LTVVAPSQVVTTNIGVKNSPNNGSFPLSSSQQVVRVTATFSTSGTTIGGAEGFIGAGGNNGAGFPFVASDGAWNGASEAGYADIPLTTIANLAPGSYTIYVHGKDAAGNWGVRATATLVIDKTVPTVSVTPATTTVAFGSPVTLLVTAGDVGSTVTARQYWVDGSSTPPASPTAFTGSTITINGLAAGAHTIYVRVQDAATNWSAVASVTVNVVRAVADTKSFTATGATTPQTVSYNSTNASLRVNDSPANGTIALLSAPVHTPSTATAVMTLSCPTGNGNTAGPTVVGNAICTNGRFNLSLSAVGTSTTQRTTNRLGRYTFTYSITSGGVSSTATVTINVN
jgi:hypothetical protein